MKINFYVNPTKTCVVKTQRATSMSILMTS